MTDDQKINIDGTEYQLADLSPEAKEQLQNVQLTDQELQRLQVQIAIVQTARGTYAQALKNSLSPKEDHTITIG